MAIMDPHADQLAAQALAGHEWERSMGKRKEVYNFNIPIKHLELAKSAMLEWFDEDFLPVLVAINLDVVECYMRAIEQMVELLGDGPDAKAEAAAKLVLVGKQPKAEVVVRVEKDVGASIPMSRSSVVTPPRDSSIPTCPASSSPSSSWTSDSPPASSDSTRIASPPTSRSPSKVTIPKSLPRAPRTRQTIERECLQLAQYRLTLKAIRAQTTLMTSVIQETNAMGEDLSVVGGTVMMNRLARYERRTVKLDTWLRVEDERARKRDRALCTERMRAAGKDGPRIKGKIKAAAKGGGKLVVKAQGKKKSQIKKTGKEEVVGSDKVRRKGPGVGKGAALGIGRGRPPGKVKDQVGMDGEGKERVRRRSVGAFWRDMSGSEAAPGPEEVSGSPGLMAVSDERTRQRSRSAPPAGSDSAGSKSSGDTRSVRGEQIGRTVRAPGRSGEGGVQGETDPGRRKALLDIVMNRSNAATKLNYDRDTKSDTNSGGTTQSRSITNTATNGTKTNQDDNDRDVDDGNAKETASDGDGVQQIAQTGQKSSAADAPKAVRSPDSASEMVELEVEQMLAEELVRRDEDGDDASDDERAGGRAALC